MKRTMQLIICLAISLGAMWFVFWLSELTLGQIVDAIVTMNYWWTLPFIALTILGMYFRAIRWHYLLRPSHRLSPNQLFPSLMIGFALNGLLPARAGEFARAYALKQSRQCPFSLGFGTIVLERIFDGIVLLAFFAFTLREIPDFQPVEMFGFEINPELIRAAVDNLSILMLVFLIFVVLLLFPRVRDLVEAAIKRLPLPQRVQKRLIEMFHSFSQGMNSLRDWRLIVICLFWTVIAWALVGVSLQILYLGFREQLGASFIPLNFSQGMTICIVICLAISIPSAPGYWGLYEVGGVAAFIALGIFVGSKSAVPLSFTLVAHFFQMLPIILIGIYYMSRQNLSFKEVVQHLRIEEDNSESAAEG